MVAGVGYRRRLQASATGVGYRRRLPAMDAGDGYRRWMRAMVHPLQNFKRLPAGQCSGSGQRRGAGAGQASRVSNRAYAEASSIAVHAVNTRPARGGVMGLPVA
jgi:hypothetical protein